MGLFKSLELPVYGPAYNGASRANKLGTVKQSGIKIKVNIDPTVLAFGNPDDIPIE